MRFLFIPPSNILTSSKKLLENKESIVPAFIGLSIQAENHTFQKQNKTCHRNTI